MKVTNLTPKIYQHLKVVLAFMLEIKVQNHSPDRLISSRVQVNPNQGTHGQIIIGMHSMLYPPVYRNIINGI